MRETRPQARCQQASSSHDQRLPNADNATEPTPKEGAKRHDTGHAKSKRPIHLSKKFTRRHLLPDCPGENRNSGGSGAQSKVRRRQTENTDFVRMTHERKAERCKRSYGTSVNYEWSWPKPRAKSLCAQSANHRAQASDTHGH